MKAILLVLLLCAAAFPLAAQLNESDTLKFQLKTGVSGNLQKGNVDLFLIRGRLEFSFIPLKTLVFKSQNSSLYQTFSGRKADNDLFSRNYLYFRPERRLYPFAISYSSSNFRRRIRFRHFTGAGLTLQMLRKPGQSVKLAFNSVFEKTQFRDDQYNIARYTGKDQISVWRTTVYVAGSHLLFQKKLRVSYDAYWQPVWGYAVNNRTQLDLAFEIPLWKGLSATALYTISREAVVISGIKPTDRILSFGITYSARH